MDREILPKRRSRLRTLVPKRTLLLHNGNVQFRNITAASYRFRGNSHFIYLCGVQPPGAVLLLSPERSILFLPDVDEHSAIWTGPAPDIELTREAAAVDEVRRRSELPGILRGEGRNEILSLPSLNPQVNAELAQLLGRMPDVSGADRALAEAMIALRLVQDAAALREIRSAVAVTRAAFAAARAATKPGVPEHAVRAELEAVCGRAGMSTSFEPTVTAAAEVLHQMHCCEPLADGTLVLVDMGAETCEGYAADITRVWPVGAKFSAPQRAVYEVVKAAQLAAIAAIRPGVNFLEVHLQACRALAAGLIDIGLLKGSADALVEGGAHALFFPHGIGHLLGLDVHDLEDLGDLAGYPPGVRRSSRLGLNALRLRRDLAAGMVVTVEPGFYRIPALLENPERTNAFKDCIDWGVLGSLGDVRGIRIEDDILVTEDGAEVLSADIPKEAHQLER